MAIQHCALEIRDGIYFAGLFIKIFLFAFSYIPILELLREPRGMVSLTHLSQSSTRSSHHYFHRRLFNEAQETCP